MEISYFEKEFRDQYVRGLLDYLYNYGGKGADLTSLSRSPEERLRAFGLADFQLSRALEALKRYKGKKGFRVGRLSEYSCYFAYIVDLNRPTAVILPGGGYGFVALDNEGFDYMEAMERYGFNAVIIKYSCLSGARFPNPLLEAVKALNECSMTGMLENGYFLVGSSAGGHLAGLLGDFLPRAGLPFPKAEVLCYPVITLGPKTHAGSRDNFLGEYREEPRYQRLFSVENNINADYPPTVAWAYKGDGCVDSANLLLLEKALAEKGIKHEVFSYDGDAHGVGLGKGTVSEGWLEKAMDFVYRFVH